MAKKRFTATRVIVLALVLAALCGIVCVAVNRDRLRLERLAGRCGGSLKGLEYEIADLYRQRAFQDPWMVCAVKLGGDASGTLYDVSAYREGPVYSNGVNVAEAFAREMRAETGDCFFERAAAPGCLYRISDVRGGGWTLFSVYDPDQELYYLFFDSFYLQN